MTPFLSPNLGRLNENMSVCVADFGLSKKISQGLLPSRDCQPDAGQVDYHRGLAGPCLYQQERVVRVSQQD